MKAAVNGDANRAFFVVTYARRKGEEIPEGEEVLAHGQLVQAGEEGDHTKAVIGHASNFQCSGDDPTTGGCRNLHAHSEHRVIARLIDDGRVNVVERKYHPKVAGGVAVPGKPFVAEHDDVDIRVEVREIVNTQEEELTPKTISLRSLQLMEPDLAQREQRAQVRAQLREIAERFEIEQVAPMRAQVEQYKDLFKDLPDAVVKPTLEEALQLLDDAAREFGEKRDEYLRLPHPDANAVRGLQGHIPRVQQLLQGVLAPIRRLEQRAQIVLAAQRAVRAEIARVDELERRVDAMKAELPTLDVSEIKLDELRPKLEALLAKTNDAPRPDYVEQLDLPPLRDLIAGCGRDLDARVAEERAVRDAFQERVEAFELIRQGKAGTQDVFTFIESGGCYPGFALLYWSGRAKALVEEIRPRLPDVSRLRYDVAADRKALAKAEKDLGPLQEFMDLLDQEMTKRAQGVHASFEVTGSVVAAPTAWVKVLDENDRGLQRLQVNIRNNSDRPMVVDLRRGDEALRTVTLGAKGRMATFEIDGVQGPLALAVTALGPQGARISRGQQETLHNVDVRSVEFSVAAVGAIRHVLPYTYTPLPDQPRGKRKVVFEPDNADVKYATQRIPRAGAE